MVKNSSDVIISVRVTPRMARNEIKAIMADGTVKIRLTAPPVNGKANDCLINYLADLLGVKNTDIEIISGSTSHTKFISINNMNHEKVWEIINSAIKRI